MNDIEETLTRAAEKVAPLSSVVSTEQVVAICSALAVAIKRDAPERQEQKWATCGQLAKHFGYSTRSAFLPVLEALLRKYPGKIRKFTQEYLNYKGSFSKSTERYCIEDIEALLIEGSAQ